MLNGERLDEVARCRLAVFSETRQCFFEARQCFFEARQCFSEARQCFSEAKKRGDLIRGQGRTAGANYRQVLSGVAARMVLRSIQPIS